MKKALFFDYDGTLCSDVTHCISENVKQTLIALHEKGYLLFLNTGRTNPIIEEEVRALPFDGYLLGCGSYIEYHQEILMKKYVDPALKDRIIAMVEEGKMEAFFEGHDKIYRTRMHSPRMVEIIERHEANGIVMPLVEEMEHDFVKMFVCYSDQEKAEEFRVFMSQYFEYIDRGYPYAELITKGNSKATAIQMILEHVGIARENCYVFGDSSNDLPMFEYIGNSALLCNAMETGKLEELRSKVMFVCDDADHDGLVEAVNQFKLL